jgi:hypothetical protein
MPPGSTVVPIAARACMPLVPKTSLSRSDAPSITADVSVNPSAHFTKPRSLERSVARSEGESARNNAADVVTKRVWRFPQLISKLLQSIFRANIVCVGSAYGTIRHGNEQ